MYLRLRVGQPIGSKIKRDEMINTYGDATVIPDYWFVLSESRADAIYDFFHNISNDFRIYGALDEMAIERCGLELVREGREAVGTISNFNESSTLVFLINAHIEDFLIKSLNKK